MRIASLLEEGSLQPPRILGALGRSQPILAGNDFGLSSSAANTRRYVASFGHEISDAIAAALGT